MMMSPCEFSTYFNNAQDCYPPLLEQCAVKEEPEFWGLNQDGRTVRWMRSVQSVIMGVFSNVSAIAGMILGAIAGTGIALIARDAGLIANTAGRGMDLGFRFGICAGAVIGSIITSVIIPPASGAANFIDYCFIKRAKT